MYDRKACFSTRLRYHRSAVPPCDPRVLTDPTGAPPMPPRCRPPATASFWKRAYRRRRYRRATPSTGTRPGPRHPQWLKSVTRTCRNGRPLSARSGPGASCSERPLSALPGPDLPADRSGRRIPPLQLLCAPTDRPSRMGARPAVRGLEWECGAKPGPRQSQIGPALFDPGSSRVP